MKKLRLKCYKSFFFLKVVLLHLIFFLQDDLRTICYSHKYVAMQLHFNVSAYFPYLHYFKPRQALSNKIMSDIFAIAIAASNSLIVVFAAGFDVGSANYRGHPVGPIPGGVSCAMAGGLRSLLLAAQRLCHNLQGPLQE